MLRSDAVDVTIDPIHGGEVRSIRHRPSGTELLFRSPWAPKRSRRGQPLDEEGWVAGYRGGWQVLFPNAGNACVHDGRRHGFHGAASVDPWDWDGDALRYVDETFEYVRRPRLDGVRFWFEEHILNLTSRPRAFVSVQHLAFGQGLLSPTVYVDADVSRAERLLEDEVALEAAGDRRLDWDRWRLLSLADSESRFGVIEVPSARYRISNPTRGLGVEVAWTATLWPFAWYWAEVRSIQARPWAGRSEVLALEPASTPHSLGLSVSERRGDATVLEGGQQLDARIEVAILTS
ncbi:MAG: hypothetical protein HYX52_01870 [Chloroflexi bacterium]|nr:hypothetical protein [Chloroflexota bacterium]